MRDFLTGCEYQEVTNDISYIDEYINKNKLLKKYLNHNHLKGLKIFYPEIYFEDRMASSFYYYGIIAIYNWRDEENIIKLRELINNISDITGNHRIISMKKEEIFSDLFSLYIMASDTEVFTFDNLGFIYDLIKGNEDEVLNEINIYFNNIIENNNKISRPKISYNENKVLEQIGTCINDLIKS